jgi:hypothetical protein
MKITRLSGLLGAVVLAVAACGGDDPPKFADEEPSSGGGKSGKGGGSSTAGKTGDAGGEGGTSPAAEGIDVLITAPAAASDPNTDDVLVSNEVTVLCSVKPEEEVNLDGSSVVIDVLDAAGEVALGQDEKPLTAVGVPTTEPNEYSASFVLTSVATGEVSFRCSAASVDKASGGADEVSTFIDHGPTIVAKAPLADSPHALKGKMPVEFTVVPSRLTDDDAGAEVTSVTLSVAGASIKGAALVRDEEDPSTYRAEIDFSDQILFKDPPPEHTSVHIEATNAREPKAVTAVNDYAIVVDGKGPDIEYVSPQPNWTVHGETVVEFTAVDSGAGVDLDTVELFLTGVAAPYKYDASKPTIWTKTGNTFKFRFDSLSSDLADVAYQINVTIRAQDTAGNLTDGKVLVLNKDDYGPSIDLDPGNARGINSQNVCSKSFDPLYLAVNDEEKKSVTSVMLRALVYDRTNQGSGGNVYYMAGTDRNSVRLYIQPNPSEPLLKDTDEDGICDDLVRENFPYVSLAALARGGSLEYAADGTEAPPVAGRCTVPTTPSGTSGPMCNGTSDMHGVIQHDVGTGGDEPVVYAFSPSASGFECTGKQLDLNPYTAPGGVSLSADGWVCLAVKAKDNRGNTTVSRPLRVCLDDPTVSWPGDGLPGCMKGAAPPTCVSSCSPPPPIGPHIYRN